MIEGVLVMRDAAPNIILQYLCTLHDSWHVSQYCVCETVTTKFVNGK